MSGQIIFDFSEQGEIIIPTYEEIIFTQNVSVYNCSISCNCIYLFILYFIIILLKIIYLLRKMIVNNK